jgi:malate dehydrogenase (oxaloacetate-decarboxylating)
MARSGIKKKKQDTGATLAQDALRLHKKHKGKLQVAGFGPLTRIFDLNLVYTPGVGAVSSYVAEHKDQAREYTLKGRTIAVVSDGSAVLGLGNIGPEGALPVMEGKALLFKTLAGIDAFPIVLSTQDPDEIVDTVARIAPTFGGINLEDIAAPKCFYIEKKLQETLGIPVMHDDQHGTAVVVLAGLINAMKVVKKNLHKARIAIVGAGAAGTATAHLLLQYGVGDIVVLDRTGIIAKSRTDLAHDKRLLAEATNREGRTGGALQACAGADAVVGLSGPGTILSEHIRVMAQRPVVFALANPTPEIMPGDAKKAGAVVVATGRSDFPNQINNALVFPGMFRGELDHGVHMITDTMQIKAACALAALVATPVTGSIIPRVFDRRVAHAVASAIKP